jgi:mannose-1-phosphate guanylyltransferase/mannose-6-phosphate isomerase
LKFYAKVDFCGFLDVKEGSSMKVIILAGGSGTRLWPLSRTNYPKQFLKLKNMDKSIFQLTIERSLKLTTLEQIYFVTNKDYKFFVTGQMEEMGHKPIEENILLEPESKNTLPAIYYAIHEIRKHGEDFVTILPSDHLVKDVDQFAASILSALVTSNLAKLFKAAFLLRNSKKNPSIQ